MYVSLSFILKIPPVPKLLRDELRNCLRRDVDDIVVDFDVNNVIVPGDLRLRATDGVASSKDLFVHENQFDSNVCKEVYGNFAQRLGALEFSNSSEVKSQCDRIEEIRRKEERTL